MSSNFPVVPSGIPLPQPPTTVDELFRWAGRVTQAIQHLNRVMASALTDATYSLFGQDSLTTTQSVLVRPGNGVIVPDHYEIALGTTLEIGAGAVFEIA